MSLSVWAISTENGYGSEETTVLAESAALAAKRFEGDPPKEGTITKVELVVRVDIDAR